MKLLRTFFITTLCVFSFALTASADIGRVYFDHTFDYIFTRNDVNREVGPILIIDTDGDSISAANGIRIIIPETLYTLWEPAKTQLQLTGSAVTQGKIAALVTPIYSESLREVYVPVLGTFTRGMDVSISGLSQRAYRISNDRRNILLDVNGDHVGDVANFRTISISSTEIRTDGTAPYSVKSAAAVKQGEGVRLSWVDPVDYDLERIVITKKLTRAGVMATTNIEVYPRDQQYLDAALQAGDSVVYEIAARDNSLNLSELVSVSYQVATVVTPPVVVVPAPATPEQSESETPQGRMLSQMKEAGTFTGVFTQPQLRSTLYSSFASQLVMSFNDEACSASRAHVLAQKCLQAAKKFGILSSSIPRRMSKADLVDMLLKYLVRKGNATVLYQAPASLSCSGVSATKAAKAYSSFINAQKFGFMPEGNFSCDYFKSITRADAINIADLFFVKNIR